MNESFLCYAMHPLPDQDSLNREISFRKHGNYSIKFLSKGRGIKKVSCLSAQEIALVQFQKSSLGLMSIPHMDSVTDAPYGLAYDFLLRASRMIYCPIASFYGFVVFTTPEHDFARSQSLLDIQQYPSALLHLDRAIITLSERTDISDQIDKTYRKFQGLQNLYINQHATPEGKLACELAIRHGQKCYNLLSSSLEGIN